MKLFEIHPLWDNRSEILKHAFAKTTYIKKFRSWKIYWKRQDLKWHRYDPAPEVAGLEELPSVIPEDALAFFRGQARYLVRALDARIHASDFGVNCLLSVNTQ